MSSSDAGKSAGRRHATAARKHTDAYRTTPRTNSDQREETARDEILQQKRCGDRTVPSGCHTETIYKELSPGALKVVRVTSFYCRLSAPPSTTPAYAAGAPPAPGDPPLQHGPASLPKALRDEPRGLQDCGSASPRASLEESSLPVNNQEEAISEYVSSTATHTFFCEFPPHHYDAGSPRSVPPASKLNSSPAASSEDGESDRRPEFTEHNKAMLSSAMVSVLAPHWSTRNQRTKKGLSAEDFEGQSVARGPHTGCGPAAPNRFLEPHRQFCGERVLRDGPHAQERDPLVVPGRRSDGWSSLSGPSSLNLNFTAKRLMPLTVSFDMDSRSLDNRDSAGRHDNLKEKAPPPVPSLSLDLHTNERMPPGGHQEPLTHSSSKPTTSSLLLSLRKIGSTWRSQAMSESNCRSLSSSNRERAAVPLSPNPSLTPPNNNSSERWMPRPYSSHIPYGTDKNNPNISQTNSVTNPSLSHLQKQLSVNQLGRQEKTSISDNSADPARLSQYEQYSILKSQALPRGTTLRSGNWWRHLTQDGSLQHGLKDSANIINNNRNDTDTPLVTPCNRNSASLSPNDNRSLNRHILNHAEHNKAKAFHTQDLPLKRQGGPDTLRRGSAEDRAERLSDMLSTHSKGFNLNEKQSQQPHILQLEANISNQNVYSLDKSHLTANTQRPQLPTSPMSSPTYMDCTSPENTSPKNQNENKFTHAFRKQSRSPDSSQDVSSQPTALPRCTYNKPKPLAFERTYPSIAVHVHPTALSIYQLPASSQTNCSPLRMGHSSPTTPSTTTTPFVHLAAPVTAPTSTSPTPLISTSFLLTPPLTPTPVHSPSPKSSLSKKPRTFSEGLDISSKDISPKGRRRVTWQDSVDVQKSEDDKGQATSPLPKTSPSPLTRSPRSLESPSIFSFLRVGSPSDARQSSPLFSPVPKTTGVKTQSGERSPQPVSDNPVSPMDWKLSTSPGPDKRPSERATQCRSSTPLSLPSDLGYQLRYSSPPYSSLKSTRSPQGDAKNSLPTSPSGFQQQTLSPSPTSRPSSLSPDPAANRTPPPRSPDPIPPTQIVPLPFPNRSVSREGLKNEGADNSSRKPSLLRNNNTGASQEDNRAVVGSECISPQAAPHDKMLPPPSTRLNVIETLVYSLSKANSTDSSSNTAPRSLVQCASNTRFSVGMTPSALLRAKKSGVEGDHYYLLSQKTNAGGTKDTRLPLFTVAADSSTNGNVPSWKDERKDGSGSRPGVCLPANQETHVPHKATLESAHKGINKTDHIVSKLRQHIGGMRSDDSPNCNQSFKTPSISGSSDGNNSDITVKSNDMLEGDKEGERMDMLGDTNDELERREVEKEDRWKRNRYTLVPARQLGRKSGDDFSSSSDTIPEFNARERFSLSNQPFTEKEAQLERTSPRQLCQHFNKGDGVNVKTSKTQCGDPNPSKQPSGDPHSTTTLCAGSTNRPCSPFAPLPSTSTLSPFPTTPDDDNVFYSPKELTPPCEMGRSASPLGTARRKMSTSPSTGGPGQGLPSYSSCADLKYGIDAGRSISVSSVVSSRRLGSERISKGLRVLSVDNLSDPALETSKYKCQSMGDQGNTRSYRLSSSPGEMRSRSLPRSLTPLSCWSSGSSPPKSQSPTTSPQDRLPGPRSRDTGRVQYYPEGALTPPPSPALPAAGLMSKPRRSTSPVSPGASGDGLSVRGMLPTRGLVASLSDCDESSDSSSDSTTDDEYYLESEEDDDKESAL